MIMTVRQTIERFFRDRQAYCSGATLKTYRGHIKFFIDYLEETYKPVSELTFNDIPENAALMVDFIIYLQKQHDCKNTSIRSYCRPVKAYLRYCYEEDYCRDYLKRIRMPKDDSTIQMPLFRDEVEKIDALFERRYCLKRLKRNYCIFHLMLDCGLRSQEVRNLNVTDIDRERNILTIVNSKGQKSRIVLVPDFLLEEIYQYLGTSTSGVVFRDLKTGEALTPNAIKQLFQDLKRNSGVNKLHAHLCRHTFATSYLVGGGNLEFLRALLGHYDYTVTKNYTQMAAQIKMLGLEIYKLDPIFFTRGY